MNLINNLFNSCKYINNFLSVRFAFSGIINSKPYVLPTNNLIKQITVSLHDRCLGLASTPLSHTATKGGCNWLCFAKRQGSTSQRIIV